MVVAAVALLLAAVARADTPRWAGVEHVIAHRGSSADRPENTLAAIRRAIEAGATGVEVDVRTTRDGHLVILHDATLDRTTDNIGAIREKTLAEVRRLDAGSWFKPEFAAERVPTFKEVLGLCGDRIDVLVDLKEQGEEYARAVAAEVRAHGAPKRTVLGVRSVEQARLLRRLLPESPQMGMIPNPAAIEAFAEAGVETIRLWPHWLRDDANLADRVRKAGRKLHLNASTGEPGEIQPLLRHKPTSLLVDDPARLIQTLEAL